MNVSLHVGRLVSIVSLIVCHIAAAPLLTRLRVLIDNSSYLSNSTRVLRCPSSDVTPKVSQALCKFSPTLFSIASRFHRR